MTKRKKTRQNKKTNKQKKQKKTKEQRKKKIHIYIYKLLFMIRGMLSAYSKRKRYLLHFEFQNKES